MIILTTIYGYKVLIRTTDIDYCIENGTNSRIYLRSGNYYDVKDTLSEIQTEVCAIRKDL